MPKSVWIIRILLLIAAVGVARSARADITYTVNETVGGGSATGFITTDGVLGTITQADILDWNLIINDGTNPTFDLLGPLESGSNSGVATAKSDLTATSTQLLFNFSNTDLGFLIFQNPFAPHSGGPFLCFLGIFATGCGGTDPGSDVSLTTMPVNSSFVFTDVQFTSLTGDQAIAGGAVATPEPSTTTLMLAGIGLGLLVMRKR